MIPIWLAILWLAFWLFFIATAFHVDAQTGFGMVLFCGFINCALLYFMGGKRGTNREH